jgi:hypothetical protein
MSDEQMDAIIEKLPYWVDQLGGIRNLVLGGLLLLMLGPDHQRLSACSSSAYGVCIRSNTAFITDPELFSKPSSCTQAYLRCGQVGWQLQSTWIQASEAVTLLNYCCAEH